MLQAVRSAPSVLGQSTDLVIGFLHAQAAADGGFVGRSGASDLYYTVFGLEGLLALGAEVSPEKVETYLRSFGGGDGLDLVHLACLARCWSHLPAGRLPEDARRGILDNLRKYQSPDGGYAQFGEADCSSAYGCFLALAAFQDLGDAIPSPSILRRCLEALRTLDGAYANEPGLSTGSTSATAAAATILQSVGGPVDSGVGDWLLARYMPGGGFVASPETPAPDLLSTATCLHALAGLGIPLDEVREPCLDFIDSLWNSRGGFCGHWADDFLDCEYTYYGLLALGHLRQ
jgi:prenyltransferase beta subunit